MSHGHWSGDRRDDGNRPPNGLRDALAMIWRDARPEIARAARRLVKKITRR